MAAINSLTYLLYSILTLAANNKPTTDPSLKAWEIGSESEVTESWNQEPHYVTRKYNEESCPEGETWSDCDAGCQTTCENVGKPVICPRMCVPGCVCEEPGTVRGPDKKCIHPPLCPSADEPPVTPYDIPVTLNGEWEPNRRYENKKRNEESCPAGETWSECDAACQTTCENVGKPVICPRMCIPGCVCEDPGTVRGPDKKCIHPPLCPKSDVDPDDPDRAEQDPNRGDIETCTKAHEIRSCETHCQRNCSNWQQNIICPRVCFMGCVCEPRFVRGPDGNCIQPQQCPPEKSSNNQEPYPGMLRYGGCPNNNACTEYCKKRGKNIGSCQGFQRMECLCFDHW